jgi:hypothetical protein
VAAEKELNVHHASLLPHQLQRGDARRQGDGEGAAVEPVRPRVLRVERRGSQQERRKREASFHPDGRVASGGGGGDGGGSEPDRGACPTSVEGGYDVLQGCQAEGYEPVTEPEPKAVDTRDDVIDSQERLPDCSHTATWTKDWHGPYCNGQAPTGSVLTAYNAEINAMLARGGMCAELARFGQMLLSRGMVRYYTSTGPTAKSWGGSGIGIIMDDSYIVNQPPYDHGFALAHELEHAYSGYVHPADGSDRDANGVSRTPNDWCG